MLKQTFCIFNQTRESFLSLDVTLADTHLARLKGLLGRMKLRSDKGLWMVPSQGIHTIGMLFPIDLIYLDAENRVIHLIENLGTFRIAPIRRDCASVLELQTRTIHYSNTQVGDELLICSPEEIESYLNSIKSTSVATVNVNRNKVMCRGDWLMRLVNWFKWWPQRFQDRRRTPRTAEPLVLAYYWDGSVPLAHRLRDISRVGAYLYTTERWYLGTVIKLSLEPEQAVKGEIGSKTPAESITMWSKVVRHGTDGVGLDFISFNRRERENLQHLLGRRRIKYEKSHA